MAYNVLKGAVEGSVDQHADQEIDGVKVFKNTVSASVFWDTDAQSPCATMKDVALTSIKGNRVGSVLTLTGENTATANYGLTFENNTLRTPKIFSDEIAGSATGLTNIQASNISGQIPADNINFGPGLHNVRGAIQVQMGSGLTLGENGVGVSLSPESGLSVDSGMLVVDPSQASQINTAGQNLSDSDLLLVSDISSGRLQSTTLGNLYDGYLKIKTPQPQGDKGNVQLKGPDGFESSSKLSYNTADEALNVAGRINTSKINIDGDMRCTGAVYQNITSTSDEVYEVREQDYTILCDAHTNPVIVSLPPACNSTGRVITVKKTNTNKHSIRSNPVAIKVSEGTIDLTDRVILKMNYSSRTLQSDGNNWWVIGAKGS
jgi:hypothetical protein